MEYPIYNLSANNSDIHIQNEKKEYKALELGL